MTSTDRVDSAMPIPKPPTDQPTMISHSGTASTSDPADANVPITMQAVPSSTRARRSASASTLAALHAPANHVKAAPVMHAPAAAIPRSAVLHQRQRQICLGAGETGGEQTSRGQDARQATASAPRPCWQEPSSRQPDGYHARPAARATSETSRWPATVSASTPRARTIAVPVAARTRSPLPEPAARKDGISTTRQTSASAGNRQEDPPPPEMFGDRAGDQRADERRERPRAGDHREGTRSQVIGVHLPDHDVQRDSGQSLASTLDAAADQEDGHRSSRHQPPADRR